MAEESVFEKVSSQEETISTFNGTECAVEIRIFDNKLEQRRVCQIAIPINIGLVDMIDYSQAFNESTQDLLSEVRKGELLNPNNITLIPVAFSKNSDGEVSPTNYFLLKFELQNRRLQFNTISELGLRIVKKIVGEVSETF